jgi:hypothetical protein
MFDWSGPSSVALIPMASDVFVPNPKAMQCPSFDLAEFASQHLDDDLTRAHRASTKGVSTAKLLKGFDLVVADEYNHCVRLIGPDGM